MVLCKDFLGSITGEKVKRQDQQAEAQEICAHAAWKRARDHRTGPPVYLSKFESASETNLVPVVSTGDDGCE